MGEKANYGQQYVARVEAGERLASPEFAATCDQVFGTPDTFAGLRQRVSKQGYPSWFAPYVDAERNAAGILHYSAALVMGLLQTAEYARAVFRATKPLDTAEETDARVARRLKRHEVMQRATPPLLWCVLHEACLRTAIGGREVIRAQLASPLAEAESPHITLQVLPFAVGAPPAVESLTLLTFDEGPSVAYTDTAMAGQLIDSPAAVAGATAKYDHLRAAAMHPEQSLAMIRRAMEDYTR